MLGTSYTSNCLFTILEKEKKQKLKFLYNSRDIQTFKKWKWEQWIFFWINEEDEIFISKGGESLLKERLDDKIYWQKKQSENNMNTML